MVLAALLVLSSAAFFLSVYMLVLEVMTSVLCRASVKKMQMTKLFFC